MAIVAPVVVQLLKRAALALQAVQLRRVAQQLHSGRYYLKEFILLFAAYQLLSCCIELESVTTRACVLTELVVNAEVFSQHDLSPIYYFIFALRRACELHLLGNSLSVNQEGP